MARWHHKIPKCVECQKPWTTTNSCGLKKHTIEYVDGSLDYHCQNCDKKFVTQSFLNEHMEKHNMIQCSHCEKSFGGKESFQEHMRASHLEKKFQCPHCPSMRHSQVDSQTISRTNFDLGQLISYK